MSSNLHSADSKEYQEVCLKLNVNESVGSVTRKIEDECGFRDILSLAKRRRCIRTTKSNGESSRSHLLYIIFSTFRSFPNYTSIRSMRTFKAFIWKQPLTSILATACDCSLLPFPCPRFGANG